MHCSIRRLSRPAVAVLSLLVTVPLRAQSDIAQDPDVLGAEPLGDGFVDRVR